MSIERYSVFARTALSAAAIVVMAAPALAQNTTAGIAGRVTDAAGNPVAGATVSVLHVESRSVSQAILLVAGWGRVLSGAESESSRASSRAVMEKKMAAV